ncbi:MAG: hypothetical protein O7I42_22080 [Alphaproteobacteria bacterium]|nr:hypothetical protein [Alphaproteobacteria bacterium]
MTKETYKFSGSGKVTTYNWMWKSARLALESAQNSEEGRFFNSMNALVYSAFAMEAFFNHLGLHLVDDWEKQERKLSKYKKLMKFRNDLGITSDIKSEPYLSVSDAFDFRDLLAHGRTETIEKQEVLELSEEEAKRYMIDTEWMDFCTLDNAQRVFENIEKVITELYKAAELGDYPFLHFHSSVYSRA